MDSAKLILTQPVSPPSPLESLNQIEGSSEERKKQVAKDFESILINRLLGEMRKTIGDWGFEKDGASEQIQGIFWMFLAQELADNGGMGMWKDIYKSLTSSEQINQVNQGGEIESMDSKV